MEQEINNAELKIYPKLTNWDKKCMAYHEAGHAVCSYYLPERPPLLCITIDPSNKAFGMIKTEDRPHHNDTEISLMSMIATLLAGRISEEYFLGCKTTSCIYDLEAVHQIATDMVLKFGMGETLGVCALVTANEKILSETQKDLICKDIQKIILTAEEKSKALIKIHQEITCKLAEKLLQVGTVTEKDIKQFFESENSKNTKTSILATTN